MKTSTEKLLFLYYTTARLFLSSVLFTRFSDLSSKTRTAVKCIMCSTYDFSPDLIAKLECYIITGTWPNAFTLNNMQITWCTSYYYMWFSQVYFFQRKRAVFFFSIFKVEYVSTWIPDENRRNLRLTLINLKVIICRIRFLKHSTSFWLYL